MMKLIGNKITKVDVSFDQIDLRFEMLSHLKNLEAKIKDMTELITSKHNTLKLPLLKFAEFMYLLK